MANCLEFDKIVTKTGRTIPEAGLPRTALLLYTVPAGHVAKINQADNLGSGLMYSVESAAGLPLGAYNTGNLGYGFPSRHRNMTGSWMTAGDKLWVTDMYDTNSTVASSHPDGFHAVVIEYDVVNC